MTQTIEQQLLTQIDELLVKIAELEEVIKGKEEVVLVPDNIRIENGFGDWDELWIIFNGGEQSLYCDFISWENNLGVYGVGRANDDGLSQCKLVKVDKKDRKVGYTYYRDNNNRDNNNLCDISTISYYCKYTWEGKHVCIDYDSDIRVCDSDYKHRYQVVPF